MAPSSGAGDAHRRARTYSDPVRSSHGHFVKSSGLRWLSFMVLTPVPWAGRIKAWAPKNPTPPMLVPCFAGSGLVVTLGELMMILELHRHGLTVTAIAQKIGLDRKTVRRYIAAGLEPRAYGPCTPEPKSTNPFLPYLRERLAAYPGLTALRLHRQLKERGFAGSYTIVKRAVRDSRPEPPKPFEVCF